MVASSCVEQDPVGIKSVHVKSSFVSTDPFFVAWSASFVSSPIQTQWWGGTDSREYRQYTGGTADAGLLAFATANPGRLYVAGDEPDQACTSPYNYAGSYHDFVAAIRGADPTARFSPAGFGDPNSNCCPPGPRTSCWDQMHSTGYAQQVYDNYTARYGVAPPVDEWRFHDWGNWCNDDVGCWYSHVSGEAAWSVSHGANMVLGSWGFIGWDTNYTNTPLYLSEIKQAMALLLNDTRINQAAWWSYENTGYAHYLKNPDGTLRQEGQQYTIVLPTDIPSSVTLVGSAGGHAKLQWTNPFAGWQTEAEFWVQPGGVGSYVYSNTDLVAPGATQTPVDAFTLGDRVKGRARYYNRLGAGPWSAFSNVVLMH